MNENPDDAPLPDATSPPAPQEPGSREFQKAEILRRFFDEDPARERELERSEIREDASRAPAPAPEQEESFAEPPVEAPPPPRPFPTHGRGGGNRPPQGRGPGGGHQRQRVDLAPRRGRGRRAAPPPPEPAPPREHDRLRGALSAADARIRNLQREVETLRNRLRSLAPPQVVAAGSGAPSGPAASAVAAPIAAQTPILREPAAPGALRDQRIAVLLDFPGLLALARKRGRSVSPAALLQGIVRGRALVRAIAYNAPPVGGELGSALRNAGFETISGEGADLRAASDLRALSRRLDAIVLVGFDDSLAGPMREAGESGARIEVAGFESHDSPELAAAARAFVRLGGEEPAGR